MQFFFFKSYYEFIDENNLTRHSRSASFLSAIK